MSYMTQKGFTVYDVLFLFITFVSQIFIGYDVNIFGIKIMVCHDSNDAATSLATWRKENVLKTYFNRRN